MKVTLTEPATIAGAYVVREQQDDGTLVLGPETSQEVIEQFADRPLSGAEMLESLDRMDAALQREGRYGRSKTEWSPTRRRRAEASA